MRTYLSLAAAGILVTGVALAQNAQRNNPAETTGQSQMRTTETGTAPIGETPPSASLRQTLRTDLQKAGFTNVRVVPDSFLVQAKDRTGQPVAMIINPHSMTELIDEGTVANNEGSGGQMAGGTASESSQMASGTAFTTVPGTDELSSKIVGTSVYNDNHQDIGTIKDIAYGPAGVKAYIVGVGGFLGMANRYVAVRPSALQLSFDHTANTWRASMNTTADQLKSAPEYKYPNEG